MRARMLISVSLLSAATLLSACGGSSSDSATADTQVVASDAAASETSSDSAESAATFNDADVLFAQNMIPHHQQAVEMAVIALDDARGASAGLKELATRIQGAQQPEIDLMTGWLTAWGKEEMPSEDMEGMDHSSMGGMEGMMTAEEMTSLESATGASFDKAWMEMMVRHHEGAVAMAKTVKTDGTSAEVKDLAGKIIVAQEAEITEMNTAIGK
jgi:uncharacterized protein (DUF305 family)